MQAHPAHQGDHIVRINLVPLSNPGSGPCTEGRDEKHLPKAQPAGGSSQTQKQAQKQAQTQAPPSFLRSLISSAEDPGVLAARPLADRQRQALRPAPPVVGTIASHEAKSGRTCAERALIHGVILSAGAVAWGFTGSDRPEEGYAGPIALTAGVVTSALLYAAYYGGPKVLDWWGTRQERQRIESQHLTAGQQLDRVVELANAQPLTTAGLRNAAARIVQLGTLHPADLPPARIAGAIAQLACGALDLPRNGQEVAPGCEAQVRLLCQALLDLHAVDGLDAPACGRALWAMAGHIGDRASDLPANVRQRVLDLALESLERLHGGTRGLTDAAYVTVLAKLSKLNVLDFPAAKDAIWRAMQHGLPGGDAPALDALIARVALLRPAYQWLLDRTVDEIARRQGDALHQDPGAMRTYMDQVVRLAGALGPALHPQGLRHLVLEHLWAPALREREGTGQEALARMPALSAALRWDLDEARARTLVECLADTAFFNTDPDTALESQHLAALVQPQTPVTTRIAIHEAASKICQGHASQRMQDLLAPATLASLVEKMPASLLPREVPAALKHLRDTAQTIVSSWAHLRIMALLSNRKDAPAGAFLRGLAGLREVAAMIRAVPGSRWHDDPRARVWVIAGLPRLCQASATEALVQQAVQALCSLPELMPVGNAQEDERRRQMLRAAIRMTCESAGTFICSADERQARERDAHHLAPIAEDFDSEPGPRPDLPPATIDHAWLTPAFIERMVAQSQSQSQPQSKPRPERKHG